MIRIFLFLFITSLSLFAVSFWTLTGLTKANIYIVNEVTSLDAKTISTTKEKMKTMLHSIGLKTEQQDSPTLMMAFREIENEGTHYVYVELALGEEVHTLREDKSPAFVISYLTNDFIEVDSDELTTEVLESVDFVLSTFVEQFEEDKD